MATSKIMSRGVGGLHDSPFSRVSRRKPVRAGGQFVGGDENRAEWPGAVEVLADGPLRRAELVVAHRGVVEDRVAADVVERLPRRCGGRRLPMMATSSPS